MNYELKWIDNNFIVTFWGIIDFNELNSLNDAIIGHVNFDRIEYQIIDFSKIDFCSFFTIL